MEIEGKRLSRGATIKVMNQFASKQIPFVFLISFSGEGNIVLTPEEASDLGMFLEMPGLVNHSFNVLSDQAIQLSKKSVDRKQYHRAFTHVVDQILYGNSFLLNLTCLTSIETNYSLRDIFLGSKARYKLLLENELVVFSPERFIRIHGDTISSNPMKGTIDADLPGAYNLLTSDQKEHAEHNTIVDLIRNDLSTIASDVRVKRFKYIERLRTNLGELLQMSSEITGKLSPDFRTSLGENLFKLLPAGSICGAPKKKTLEIIRQVENYERGYYTGVFGHFDGENLDSAVAIRFIEKQGDKMVFKSGGGITFQSDWEKEYEEMQNKVYVPIY
jgi:para-aminobenzoate synthetase component 1